MQDIKKYEANKWEYISKNYFDNDVDDVHTFQEVFVFDL